MCLARVKMLCMAETGAVRVLADLRRSGVCCLYTGKEDDPAYEI